MSVDDFIKNNPDTGRELVNLLNRLPYLKDLGDQDGINDTIKLINIYAQSCDHDATSSILNALHKTKKDDF